MAENPYAAELYARYQALWHRVAYQIVRSSEDAEDVVQEAYRKFLSVEREWDSFEDAKRYFSAIVTNTAIDCYKLQHRQRERLVDTDSQDRPDPLLIAESTKPSDFLQKAREERLVHEAKEILRGLPVGQREAIERLLLDEEGKSLSDVSRETGIPISTLKSRALLGLEKVRKNLRKKHLL